MVTTPDVKTRLWSDSGLVLTFIIDSRSAMQLLTLLVTILRLLARGVRNDLSMPSGTFVFDFGAQTVILIPVPNVVSRLLVTF